MFPGWREGLEKLERILIESEPASALESLGDPSFLPWLFTVELDVLVRRGPGEEGANPAHLLKLAREAATLGLLPLKALAALRRRLERIEDAVRSEKYWSVSEPLWWRPLPERGSCEALWDDLDDGKAISLPSSVDVQKALAEGGEGWYSFSNLLEAELLQGLWSELEGGAVWGLERGDVGSGQISARRSDEVTYLTGREDGLMNQAPQLATLVQWSLERWGQWLRKALPEVSIHPPGRAMLARYPAPSAGYAAHMDNPGGEKDNGRVLTLVIYLNPEDQPCLGGEIAVWSPGQRTSDSPIHESPPQGGNAVLFDSSTAAHRVNPLGEGPPRWALTLWFNEKPQRAPELPSPRRPSPDEILRPVANPPLDGGVVLLHELEDREPGGRIRALRRPDRRVRSGIVATVYGAGRDLETWCRHHFDRGIDHGILIFDHFEEPQEQATAEFLRRRFSADQLTLLSGEEVTARWVDLPDDPRLTPVRPLARSGGNSSYEVASRQTLHASVILQAAKTEEFGGEPLDWLVHLDADELLWPQGRGRGGDDLAEHLAVCDAAGIRQVRFLNHELMGTRSTGDPPRFKANPRLAASLLGPQGWKAIVEHLELGQTDPRPWFHGYFNGKSAVAVAFGHLAAGVHGWFLEGPEPPPPRLVAGPSVLHFHYASSEGFRRRYLRLAKAGAPPGPLPFEPCPAEETALRLVTSLEEAGEPEDVIGERLEDLHRELTLFSDGDLEILEGAGLILRPPLEAWLAVGEVP